MRKELSGTNIEDTDYKIHADYDPENLQNQTTIISLLENYSRLF